MKKFFTIIALFISVIAYGQVEYEQFTFTNTVSKKTSNVTCKTLTIGDYISKRALDSSYDYYFVCEDKEEAQALASFIRNNKEQIEKKYDIRFKELYILKNIYADMPIDTYVQVINFYDSVLSEGIKIGKVVGVSEDRVVMVHVMTNEEHQMDLEREERLAKYREQREQAKQERINSLSNILDK